MAKALKQNVVKKKYVVEYVYTPRTERVTSVFYAESPEAAKLRLQAHLQPNAKFEILSVKEEKELGKK